jgi:hypothetical protein
MKTVFSILFFCFISIEILAQSAPVKNDSCKVSLGGKTGGFISLTELKNLKGLQYADTLNCDYRLKQVEFIVKDKMGMDIISQTTHVFLDDMKKAIARLEKGNKITIEAIIWTDKKRTGFFTQTMKFEIK